jgi:hypothetical protein
MRETPTTQGQQPGANAAMNENSPPAPLRIRIDVPLGTPYQEIRDSVLRQAWRLAGTQLRAAIALGIRPETVSRNLRWAERDRAIASSERRVTSSERASLDFQPHVGPVSRRERNGGEPGD